MLTVRIGPQFCNGLLPILDWKTSYINSESYLRLPPSPLRNFPGILLLESMTVPSCWITQKHPSALLNQDKDT